jgi:hypothetical protein
MKRRKKGKKYLQLTKEFCIFSVGMWTQPSGKGCNFLKLLFYFFFQGKKLVCGVDVSQKKNVKVCNQANHADFSFSFHCFLSSESSRKRCTFIESRYHALQIITESTFSNNQKG